jgi:hypothetical protein
MTKKTFFILQLRLRQLYRMLHEIGWVLLAVFLVVSAGMFFSLSSSLMKIQSLYAGPVFGIILLMIDYARKDKAFLISIFEAKKDLWFHFLVEYFIVSIPIFLFQLFYQHWLSAFLIIVSVFLVSFIALYSKNSEVTLSKVSFPFIPIRYFEFKFHFESAWFAYLFLWIVGMGGVIHYALLLIFLFLTAMLLPSMLTSFEAREMLKFSPFFIWKKTVNIIFPISVYILIPVVLTLWFHAEMFGVISYGVACVWVAGFMSIVLKYVSYTPIRPKFEMSNIAAVLLLFMLLPGGILITLTYSLFKSSAAQKNLKSQYA